MYVAINLADPVYYKSAWHNSLLKIIMVAHTEAMSQNVQVQIYKFALEISKL